LATTIRLKTAKPLSRNQHNTDVYQRAIADPLQLLLLAEHNGEFQAYLYAKPTTLPVSESLAGAHELSKIYTRHSCQGQGIGVRLLQNWESWAKTQNQNDVVLGVWSENKDAQRFYSRYGYKKISEYKLSVGDVQDTDYIYHKTL